MSSKADSAPRLALEAARMTVGDPLAVLALFAVHLLFVGALWVAASWAFRDGALLNRPAPTAFDVAAVALSHPSGLRRLLLAWTMIGSFYLLGGALLAGALLTRLQRRSTVLRTVDRLLDGPRGLRPSTASPPTAGPSGHGPRGQSTVLRTALRHVAPLLVLRIATLGLASLLVAGAVASLPWLFEKSLAVTDERLQALLLVGMVLPVLLAMLACALLLHYGQPLLLEGCRFRAVFGRALALIHRRPVGTSSLYLGGWVAWLGITLLGIAGLPAPATALLRVAVHVWSYAAALRVAQRWHASSASPDGAFRRDR